MIQRRRRRRREPRKNNPQDPPRKKLAVMLPTDRADVLIESAREENKSVSRLLAELLVPEE